MDNLKLRGQKNIIYSWKFCENCNEYCQHFNYIAREWEYLLFLPLFPKGPHIHVINECPTCKRRDFFYETKISDLVEESKKDIQNAINALPHGQKKLKRNGNEHMVSCSETLTAWCYFLYCIGNNSIVDNLLITLKEKSLHTVSCLVKGRLLEFSGRLEDAIKLYEQAVKEEPDNEGAYILLSQAYLGTKNLKKSRNTYEKLLQITEDKIKILLILLDIYNELGDNVKIIKTFEHCFELDPKLKKEKKFVKEYKKACSRACNASSFNPTDGRPTGSLG